MSGHAILSASSAHRWMSCTPSARLEQEFKDTTSEAAAEGSAAHALAEHKLRKALKMRSKKPVSKYDSDEMDVFTDDYVGFILEQLAQVKLQCQDPLVLIEQKLDFSRYVPEGFGTGDCLIIADGTMHIIDFKYGQGVLVEVEENPQMMLYALGALEYFDDIYDIDKVSMTIFQPRRENVSTYMVPKKTLYLWAAEILVPTAKIAFEGAGEYVPGEHCRFCRAEVKCRARAEAKLKLAAFEFALPPLLSDEEIAEILQKLDDLVSWANVIRDYAMATAIEGKKWPGWKIVAGRSVRRYTDEEAVAAVLKNAGYRDIYRQILITITETEKLLGKKKFNEVLGDYVIKPQGRPVLVPESDKRPVLDLIKASEDFEREL
jgi:hypothetical protein